MFWIDGVSAVTVWGTVTMFLIDGVSAVTVWGTVTIFVNDRLSVVTGLGYSDHVLDWQAIFMFLWYDNPV